MLDSPLGTADTGPSNVQINKAIDRAWKRIENAALIYVYAEVIPVVRADERRRIVEALREAGRHGKGEFMRMADWIERECGGTNLAKAFSKQPPVRQRFDYEADRTRLRDMVERLIPQLDEVSAERNSLYAEKIILNYNLGQTVKQVMDAQADVQSALGQVRLALASDNEDQEDLNLGALENYLARSLAIQHKLLDFLGKPMYDPATHPDVNT